MGFDRDFASIWDEIKDLIDPKWDSLNCSATHGDTPPAFYFLRNLQTSEIVLISVASALTLVTLLLAFVHWYHVWHYVSDEKRQNKLYFLISLLPVSALCAYLGLLAPRTAVVLTSVGVLYYLLCLFVLTSLARNLFGGRGSFSTTLKYDEKRINFQSPPFCCCCFCLPTAAATEKNLRRLEWCVLQAPVVRAIIVVSNVVAIAELRNAGDHWLHFSEMASVISLLLAVFGMHTIARLTADKLSPYGFMAIFRMVDIALLQFTALQPMLFEFIFMRVFNLFDCGPQLTRIQNARFMCNFVLVCQTFVFSLIATALFTPERNALFDKYRGRKSTLELNLTEESMLTPDI